MFCAKSAVGVELLGLIICRSYLWLWAFFTWTGWLPSYSRFFGSDYAVAVFAGCIRTQGQVAVVKSAAFGFAFFGDTAVF